MRIGRDDLKKLDISQLKGNHKFLAQVNTYKRVQMKNVSTHCNKEDSNI